MSDENKDPALQEALERLEREAQPALEAWTARELEEIERARDATTDAERQTAVETFEQFATQSAGARPHALRAPLWLAAAASLLLGVGIGWLARGGDEGQPNRIESGTWLSETDASGSGLEIRLVGQGDYDRLAWKAADHPSARYSLRIHNRGESEPALEVDGLQSPSYRLSAEDRERLGAAIEIRVMLFQGDDPLPKLWAEGAAALAPASSD